MVGKIVLLPNLLDESQEASPFLPASLKEVVLSIDSLAAESEKAARRYLRRFLSHEEMNRVSLFLLNEHTDANGLDAIFDEAKRGKRLGVLSDAGLSCLADPGSEIVLKAHKFGIPVETYAGPSSLIFALQLSGFSGQRFSFHGYLPREEPFLEQTIRDLEKQSLFHTQMWIEAPYRTKKMFDTLLKVLEPNTYLSIQASLTLPSQKSITKQVFEWKKSKTEFEKEPAIFLIYRERR